MVGKKGIMIIFVVFLTLFMIGTDYHLANEDKPPIFSIKAKESKDGGTTDYFGLGYKVTDYNKLDGRQDVVFIPLYINIWK